MFCVPIFTQLSSVDHIATPNRPQYQKEFGEEKPAENCLKKWQDECCWEESVCVSQSFNHPLPIAKMT